MKRSVQKDAIVSDYTRAKFKNLAVFINTHESLGKPIIAMFYIHCWAQFLSVQFFIYQLVKSVKIRFINLCFRNIVV